MGVKVPKITLQAESGEGGSFGEVSFIGVGYGLHQMWIYACMFSAMLFPASSVIIDVPGSHGSMSIMYVVSIIAFGVALVACGLLDDHVVKPAVTKRFVMCAAALSCIGTAVSVFPGLLFGESVLFDAVAGVFTGVGSAFLIIAWGVAFARCEGTSILLNTAVAMVVAMAGYALILHYVPLVVAGIIVCALPLIEAAILARKTPEPYYERGEVPLFMPIPAKRGKFFVLFGLPVALLAFSLGMMRQVSAQLVMPAGSGEMQIFCIAAAAVAALVVALTGIALSADYSWSVFFRVGMPVIALGALCMPLSITPGGLFTIGSLCGYLMFEMLLWSFFGEVSQRFNLSPVMVFGVGRGVAALASLAGSSMLLFEGQLLDAYGLNKVWAAFAVLVIAVFGYCLLPSERNMTSMVITCPLLKAAADGILGKSVYTEAFFEKDAAVMAQASSADADAGTKGRRWFKENCEAVSQRYMLSRRETEVLFYLAKGHNSAYIQEKLFISEGTAKTHIRHIYRKLDIHNQQELMRMVEKGE